MSLRFIPKLSQGLEFPGTRAYSKVKETAATGNCSEAAVLQSSQLLRARAGLVVPLGCRLTCSVWPLTAGYLNYCAGNVTLHWYCLRNAYSSRARTEHFSSTAFWELGVGFFLKITAYFLLEWSLFFVFCVKTNAFHTFHILDPHLIETSLGYKVVYQLLVTLLFLNAQGFFNSQKLQHVTSREANFFK